MAELDPNLQAQLDAEFEQLQAARERIEQAGLSPQEREVALGGLAEREMAHVRRVQEAAEFQRQEEVFRTKEATARAQGGTLREDEQGRLSTQQAPADVGVPAALSPTLPMNIGPEMAGLARARAQLDADPQMTPERRLQAELEIRAREEELRRQGGFPAPGAPSTQEAVVQAAQGAPVAGSPSPVDTSVPAPPAVPPMLARDGVTAPATGPGSVTGTPTPAQPPTAPGARPRGTGGGRPRPQTASIAEQLLAALQNGSPDQDEILQRLVDSYQREATTRDDFGEQGSIVVDAGLQEQQELAQARREEFEQELIAQERRLQEIDTALGVLSSTRFDANRLFTDRGLATSMALGVAVNAATSLAQNALFPGANAGNTALQIVNGAIERDIQTQMVNYERGVQSVQGMRTAYEMARNLSQDRQAAYEFAAAISQRRVGEQLRGMAMQTQGLVAREQLMRQADSLLLQAAQREELARMQMAQAMFANQPRGAGGPRAGDRTGMAWAPFAVRTERSAGMTRAEVEKAIGATTAARLTEGLNGAAQALDILDEIGNYLGGYSSFSLVDRAVMQQLINSYQDAYRKASGMGALDTGALRMLEGVLSNPNDVSTPIAAFRAQLRAARSRLVRDAQRQVNTLGDGLIQWDPRSDPSGGTVSGRSGPGEGVTIVGETSPQETTLGSVATPEGGARGIRAIQGAIGEGMTRAIFGDATIDALAGGE